MRRAAHSISLLATFAWAAACGGLIVDHKDGATDGMPSGGGGTSPAGGTAGTSAQGGSVGSGGQARGGAGGGGAFATGGVLGSGGGSPPGGAGGASGSSRPDGGARTGGTIGSDGGAAAGGTSGSGGTAALDGGTGSGTGGRTGSGGSGTGGPPGSGGLATGGATGAGGATGGAAGSDAGSPDGTGDEAPGDTDAGPDLAADGPPDAEDDAPADLPLDTPGDTPDAPDPGTLESCFVGLPSPAGAQMVATKSTTDGRVRLRIALDTEDRFGTSGTMPWGLIRLAVEVDGVVTCIASRSALQYTASHHNCGDAATATAGGATYRIATPDRPSATLTIENGASPGPFSLTDTACTLVSPSGVQIACRSGGPC